MINLILINDEFEDNRIVLSDLDFSDSTLMFKVQEKQGNNFEDGDTQEINCWINKAIAKTMISYLKQQFDL